MNAFLVAPIVLGAVTLAFGLLAFHLFLRRKQREDLSFTLTCLAMAGYDFAAARAYAASVPEEKWLRAEMVLLALVAVALIRYVAHYTGEVRRSWELAFSGYFLVSSLVIAVEPWGLVWRLDHPVVRQVVLPWGSTVTYHEFAPGPLLKVQGLMGLLAFVHLFFAGVRAYRGGQKRRARPLLVGLCCFVCTLLNDLCVVNGIYELPYLLEYGYLGMVVAMVTALSSELVEAAAVKLERQLLETQLRQAARLEAVGRMTGGVAHDLNNQLAPILGYAQLALAHMTLSPEARNALEQIRDAAEHARDLARQLLLLGRKQAIKPSLISLNQMIAGSRMMLQRAVPENILLRVELQSDLGYVRADPTQLSQILHNLVLNARDAMPDGGQLTISTSNRELTGPDAGLGLEAGRYVVLVVRDSGVGMDRTTKARIFEPFFSTKDSGNNYGLGLSTVRDIVAEHGGRIRVESEPGQGACFEIWLPRADLQAPGPGD